MKTKRQRIMYIEKAVPVGGSVISLYELVRGLDTERYMPVVLFYGPNPYRERFRALGAKVITLNEQSRTATPAARPQRDIAASLGRYANWLAASYRAAKQIYLVMRQDLPLARRVARLIKDEAIDLVHHNNALAGNRSSVMAARLAGVPQVCHIRVLQDLSFVETYLARSVDVFIYISRAVEQCYREQGIPASQGQIVYDPINTRDFEQTDHVAKLRTEFGLTNQSQLISNVGRLDWWKGHDYFVQAMAQVVKSQPDTKAVIVGDLVSSPQCQAYYQRLQQMVQDLELADHVTFTGFRSDIPEIMAASDIIVHSASEPEPLGRVIVEGMAAGRPVIATAAGGVLDIIEDQVTGLLVPIKDATSMAKAIQQLLQNRDQARVMGQRAQQHAKKCFSVEQHVATVQRIYQQILVS